MSSFLERFRPRKNKQDTTGTQESTAQDNRHRQTSEIWGRINSAQAEHLDSIRAQELARQQAVQAEQQRELEAQRIKEKEAQEKRVKELQILQESGVIQGLQDIKDGLTEKDFASLRINHSTHDTSAILHFFRTQTADLPTETGCYEITAHTQGSDGSVIVGNRFIRGEAWHEEPELVQDAIVSAFLNPTRAIHPPPIPRYDPDRYPKPNRGNIIDRFFTSGHIPSGDHVEH
ncbi:MAG: hypothetical protein KBD51_00985 [Candidatus Levybacteria bacterium]|nr:hypothetical protein [Candidatus Levybacteria bacterium]